MLGVSKRTIGRRLRYFELSIRSTYCDISYDDLDIEIRSIQDNFPDSGYRMVTETLRNGLRVQQHRIRQSILRCDPEGACLRWLTAAHRRRPSVSGPQALWHIDGNQVQQV